jgi:hypothetical protein
MQKEIVAFFKKALFESRVSNIYTPSLVYCAFYKPLYKIHLLFNNFHIRVLNGHFSMFNPHILASLVNTGTIMYCLNICIVAQDIMAQDIIP